eukprot:2361238-Rhodomonas_salina.1
MVATALGRRVVLESMLLSATIETEKFALNVQVVLEGNSGKIVPGVMTVLVKVVEGVPQANAAQ